MNFSSLQGFYIRIGIHKKGILAASSAWIMVKKGIALSLFARLFSYNRTIPKTEQQSAS
jgi:hypothetical protein